MEKYKFAGDWVFELKLPEFSKLCSERFWSERNKNLKKILHSGYIPFYISDEKNYNPDPLEVQENAIHYLISHEKTIIKNLFKAFKTKINKQYAEWCGESDWIPELNAVNDLGKLLCIQRIYTLTENKANFSYLRIDFEYLGDEEHGLSVIFHKEHLIGYSEEGDTSPVYEDLGLDEREIHVNSNFGTNMVHQPIEKYGKYKPWQIEATENYFSFLIRKRQNQKFIEEVESNNWDINFRFPILEKNLIDMATYSGNLTLMNYLIENGGDFSKSMLQCTGYNFKKEAVECLFGYGASVDILGYWNFTPTYQAIEEYLSAIRFNKGFKAREQKNIVKFYISMGANFNSLNEKGEDYKTILRNKWGNEYLVKNQIEEKLSELLEFCNSDN